MTTATPEPKRAPSVGKIRIEAGNVSMTANLNDSRTAQALFDALPIEARGNRWGDEIYFGVPISHADENAREILQSGELAFWPPGGAFCIFFGPTPASVGEEIRAASPVIPLGRVVGDATQFKHVHNGTKVRLSKIEDEAQSS
ncbi:hypothetical protein JW916_00305 [Candidatus Sumerlaeota bacterium]|nr:hypothetical protein [Candidatus Sumerlaeota bacterium]